MQIKFIFDIASPNAYLSHKVIPDFEKKYDVKFDYFVCLLGGIFKLSNNKPPMIANAEIPLKYNYFGQEITRFAKFHQLTNFKMNPHFPVISLQIIRGAVAAEMDGYLEDYIDKVLVHMWEEPKKMDDPEVIKSAFEESGLDAEKLISQMQDADVKAKLIANTEAAAERGVFGIPTFFVGEEMYFGKDNLWQVEEKLSE